MRYFNPLGAHTSGLIGECPTGTRNNLMPLASQTGTSLNKVINIYGGDYHTPDGTGVRDHIHVMDVADGHFKVA